MLGTTAWGKENFPLPLLLHLLRTFLRANTHSGKSSVAAHGM